MKIINGTNCLQVKDFVETGGFGDEPPGAIVFAIWIDENGTFRESPIYKYECSADEDAVFLYLHGVIPFVRPSQPSVTFSLTEEGGGNEN